MHQEKWKEIKEKILDNFPILDQRTENNQERREELEIIEFNGPMGKMKVVWITRPKVLDKKTSYSNRIGSDVSVTTVYSADEVVHTFKLYQMDEMQEEWREVSAESFI